MTLPVISVRVVLLVSAACSVIEAALYAPTVRQAMIELPRTRSIRRLTSGLTA